MFCPILLRDPCSLTPEELGSADTILCSSWQKLGGHIFLHFLLYICAGIGEERVQNKSSHHHPGIIGDKVRAHLIIILPSHFLIGWP